MGSSAAVVCAVGPMSAGGVAGRASEARRSDGASEALAGVTEKHQGAHVGGAAGEEKHQGARGRSDSGESIRGGATEWRRASGATGGQEAYQGSVAGWVGIRRLARVAEKHQRARDEELAAKRP
ncbi:hypothetical protein CYMTET_56636 [Cymbomonas tetramitiformis]|uniref:Uncharacterized protein n=1 Tax=Cymbomonas tetramitiformis TaxID=36881 RepID=A0AAE0BBX8_9CHLO|nr:hypothetical protein CYMTET_56636 [Cymbomonas tetramitiformis]